MKRLKIIPILLILTFTSDCSSRKIKTKPDDISAWEPCPVCHGYGKVTTSSSKKPADDVTNSPANNHSCWIIFPVFNTEENPEKQTENYSASDPERNLEIMKEDIPKRSAVKKRVKCPYCEGKGWIKGDNTNSPLINKNIRIIEKDGKIEFEENNLSDR